LGLVPLFLIAVVSLRLNVFVPRYVLLSSCAYILCLSVLALGRSWWRRLLGGVIFFFVVLSLVFYYGNDYTKSPNWRALTAYLVERASPNDLVIQTAADEAYTFYHEEYGVGTEMIRLPANPTQSPEEIVSILDQRLRSAQGLWIIAQTPPGWQNSGVVEGWLAENAQRIRTTSVEGLRAEQYMNWEISSEEIDIPPTPLAYFEGYIELIAVQIDPVPEPTGELTVVLYWQQITPTDKPLKIFVHLVGAINPTTGTPLWTQDDQFPQDGHIQTDQANTHIYRDVYSLPLDNVSPGTYTLLVGWYDPATNDRLSVGGSDNYPIGEITLP
jgi:hypothetical protein